MISANEVWKLETEEEDVLFQIARDAIRHGLASGRRLLVIPEDYPPAVRQQGASFVTLKIAGRLRGCVGTIVANAPLVADVSHNAYSSAFADRRLSPLTAPEFDRVDMSISVLTPPEPLEVSSEQDAIEKLCPGTDGVILRCNQHVATFLPVVWETLSDPRDFLRQLRTKAGLPADHWSEATRLERYAVHSIVRPDWCN